MWHVLNGEKLWMKIFVNKNIIKMFSTSPNFSACSFFYGSFEELEQKARLLFTWKKYECSKSFFSLTHIMVERRIFLTLYAMEPAATEASMKEENMCFSLGFFLLFFKHLKNYLKLLWRIFHMNFPHSVPRLSHISFSISNWDSRHKQFSLNLAVNFDFFLASFPIAQ